MTQTSTGTALTQNARKYLQQLCKHWSHKALADFTPEAGSVTFESGNQLVLEADDHALKLSIEVPESGDLAHFQDVVDKHLLRFAFREKLEVVWGRR